MLNNGMLNKVMKHKSATQVKLHSYSVGWKLIKFKYGIKAATKY